MSRFIFRSLTCMNLHSNIRLTFWLLWNFWLKPSWHRKIDFCISYARFLLKALENSIEIFIFGQTFIILSFIVHFYSRLPKYHRLNHFFLTVHIFSSLISGAVWTFDKIWVRPSHLSKPSIKMDQLVSCNCGLPKHEALN